MSSSYSFLDVAVLDAVRQRFATGDALVILASDLSQVLWANGPGAALFGYPDIEAIIDTEAVLPPVARRQLMATSGFPEIGSDRAITLRLSAGITSHPVGLLASTIAMPDGEKAILLAAPVAVAGARTSSEIATRAIGGFTEDGEFLAFVDGGGHVEAASAGFAALGIADETLAALVEEVAGAADRLVKRLVPAGAKTYPAGLARLADDPARHLLVVIAEARESDDGTAEDAPGTPSAESPAEKPGPTADEAGKTAAEPPADRVAADPGMAESSQQHDHWYFAGEDHAPQTDAAPAPETTERDAPGAEAPGKASAPERDEAAAPPRPAIDRNAAPVRFVWRTDAEGAFSALSPEFAAVVGKPAADVIGHRFRDVAAAFGLDPTGEIAQLLERRDTWSGRTVQWPADGLRVPVDLAALPMYSRAREFEGFRGFGVARPADAMADPDTIDLSPKPDVSPADSDAASTVEEAGAEGAGETLRPSDPFKGEVPALSIVPKPDRRFTDKVIRLAEHRPAASDKGQLDKSLSNVERSAFREIGERLKKDSAPAEGNADAAAPAALEQAPQATVATTVAGQDAAPEISAERPADATPTGPATEPGRVNSADATPPAPADEAIEDDSERLAAIAETEDAADLARLDGMPPPDGEVPRRPRSLLDYADQASEAGEPVGPPVHGPATDPSEASADEAVVAGTTEDPDDSMAAADFADARDDETSATDDRQAGNEGDVSPAAEDAAPEESSDAAAGAARTDEPEEAAPAEALTTERPRLSVPPLRTAGVMPSAFAVASAPDTSILAKLPVPLLIHSGDALHYANDEFLHLTGYATLDDLVETGGLDALFADPYADDSAADQTDRALRMRTRDGREFPVEALLRAVPWRGGKALMLVLRRSGEAESQQGQPSAARSAPGEPVQPDVADLKARIAEMRTIIDTATDGVVLIGRDGAIRSISRPAEALFGFDSDEVAGKPFASLFAIESQRSASDYLAGLSEPGVASVLNDGREVIGREAQGRFIPLFMTVGRLPGDSGYCAVVRDITQWKRAEEDLTQARAVAERASSQKTDFLARISHEIRTPLNAIIGFSELMVDEKFGPVANDRYRDYLRDINRSGNHVLDLVNDLLDISKIEAGQQEMDYEAVSLNDTLTETVATMQPQANRERVIIRSSFASKLPEVVADLRSVRQIALNILSNAIRYTQAGGQVIVSTAYEPSGDVVMRVRDTGIGMSQAEIEQALKPFKQINALKRGRNDGTGLGLPLTKAMVEANRARFVINSTPGEGTLVEVAFPTTRVLAE
jgi:PAS domain S-box-containing protein